jgi:hypothetical protein
MLALSSLLLDAAQMPDDAILNLFCFNDSASDAVILTTRFRSFFYIDSASECCDCDDQVTTIEKSISGGSKVAEVQITTLIELLMRHAVKLESIPADGESSSQKNIQVQPITFTALHTILSFHVWRWGCRLLRPASLRFCMQFKQCHEQ